MRRVLPLMMLALTAALGGAETPGERDHRAAERFWQLLSLPYVRSIPEVRVIRRALIGAFFPRWPYRDARDGYLVIRPLFQRDPRLRLFGGHLGVEGGFDRQPEAALEGDIDSTFRLGAALRLQRSWRAGRASESGLAASTWRLLESRGSRLRALLGLRWYGDHERSGVGPLGGASLELFPTRPWVVACDADLGTVGPHLVAGASAALGRYEHAFELRAGLRLQSGWPSFHGPFLGVRYWF